MFTFMIVQSRLRCLFVLFVTLSTARRSNCEIYLSNVHLTSDAWASAVQDVRVNNEPLADPDYCDSPVNEGETSAFSLCSASLATARSRSNAQIVQTEFSGGFEIVARADYQHPFIAQARANAEGSSLFLVENPFGDVDVRLRYVVTANCGTWCRAALAINGREDLVATDGTLSGYVSLPVASGSLVGLNVRISGFASGMPTQEGGYARVAYSIHFANLPRPGDFDQPFVTALNLSDTSFTGVVPVANDIGVAELLFIEHKAFPDSKEAPHPFTGAIRISVTGSSFSSFKIPAVPTSVNGRPKRYQPWALQKIPIWLRG